MHTFSCVNSITFCPLSCPLSACFLVWFSCPRSHCVASWPRTLDDPSAGITGNLVPGIPLPLSEPLQTWSYGTHGCVWRFCMYAGDLNSDPLDFIVLPTQASSQPLICHLSSLILLVLHVFSALVLLSWALLVFNICN